jgi:hypothetical protein
VGFAWCPFAQAYAGAAAVLVEKPSDYPLLCQPDWVRFDNLQSTEFETRSPMLGYLGFIDC